jgi:hypothetical protein
MEKGETKLVKALKEDYKQLYVKEYTTGWREQRFIRNIELGVMSLKNTEEYIFQELDKARGEGRKEVINELNDLDDVEKNDEFRQYKVWAKYLIEQLSKLKTKE